jgi:hypothetical protein
MLTGVVALFALFTCLNLKADIDLWPFLEVNDKTQMVCYPAYMKEGKFMLVMNAYARTNEGKDHHIFWPFIKFSEGRVERVAPFWFQPKEKKFILLPFFYHNQNYSLWTIPPVIFNKSSNLQAVIPFYIKTMNSMFIFPNLYFSVDRGVTTTSCLPFYHSSRAHGDHCSNSKWLLPYYHQYSNDATYDLKAVYPFFIKQKDHNSSYFYLFNYLAKNNKTCSKKLLFPLFYQKTPKEETGINQLFLFPFFHNWKTDKTFAEYDLPLVFNYAYNEPNFICKSNSPIDFPNLCGVSRNKAGFKAFLFPMFSCEKSPKNWHLWLLNYYQLSSQRESTFRVFPFYLSSKHRFADEKPKSDTKWVLWPFYKQQQKYDQRSGKQISSSSHMFPFYGYSNKNYANSTLRRESLWILWPFYSRVKEYDENTGNLTSKHNRFLFFSNNLRGGKRSFSILGKVIMEQM